MTLLKRILLWSLAGLLCMCAVVVNAQPLQGNWYSQDAQGRTQLELYFFWSKKCPHCLQALPFVQKLGEQYDWLKIHSLEVSESPEHVQMYRDMAAQFGQEARSVPAFFYCGNLLIGYGDALTTGEQLRQSLLECYAFAQQHPGENLAYVDTATQSSLIELPMLGEVDSNQYSLALLTVLIAGVDAFNPCAFFVLLFLLSMMVHARRRSRMLLVGSIFVFFSGLIYFLFMAAWLNVFLYLGELRIMTLVAGVLAMFMALFNIKDYFWFQQGASLSIPQAAKPRLFDRMRQLLSMQHLSMVIPATIVLAVVANSYELLCTAGFPMVYTRILTLRGFSTTEYYLYLLAYNLVYVLPLMVIVLLFTLRLGSRKLSEKEGRVLKLLSGIMMLLLGLLLIAAPQLLNNILAAVLLLSCAIIISWIITKIFNHQGNAR